MQKTLQIKLKQNGFHTHNRLCNMLHCHILALFQNS
jgi:hypothetical protein